MTPSDLKDNVTNQKNEVIEFNKVNAEIVIANSNITNTVEKLTDKNTTLYQLSKGIQSDELIAKHK